ncbi:MAG: EAL domain-containing protein, partial [Acidimicrobiales bacterium]
LSMDRQLWTANPHLVDAAVREGIVQIVLAPIRWEGGLIGVLLLATKDPDAVKTDESRFAHFEELGSYAGSLFGAQAIEYQNAEIKRAEIDAVIAEQRFFPVFQPLVNLTTGDVVGFESLTRFSDGVSPDHRFGDARAVGRASELESACARAALSAATDLPANAFVTVNFSPSCLLDGQAELAVRGSERPVVIEITEHARVVDYTELRTAIDRIEGVRLAVDDAGAGYTSLSHILELRPDFVKLDISLVRDIDTNPARQAMVAGICHFAIQSHTIIVAEGVESEAEAATLRDLGVTLGEGSMLGQGYFFGRPSPVH